MREHPVADESGDAAEKNSRGDKEGRPLRCKVAGGGCFCRRHAKILESRIIVSRIPLQELQGRKSTTTVEDVLYPHFAEDMLF